MFEALADPVRRELFVELHVLGPRRVVDLAAERSISRPAVSRHLRLLVEAGLAVAEDRGRERHYRHRSEGLAPVIELLETVDAASSWLRPDVLDALDLEVRRTVRDHRTWEVRANAPDELKEDPA